MRTIIHDYMHGAMLYVTNRHESIGEQNNILKKQFGAKINDACLATSFTLIVFVSYNILTSILCLNLKNSNLDCVKKLFNF